MAVVNDRVGSELGRTFALRGVPFEAHDRSLLDLVQTHLPVLVGSVQAHFQVVFQKLRVLLLLEVSLLGLGLDLRVVSLGGLDNLGENFLPLLLAMGHFLVKLGNHLLLACLLLRRASLFDFQNLQHLYSAPLHHLVFNFFLIDLSLFVLSLQQLSLLSEN